MNSVRRTFVYRSVAVYFIVFICLMLLLVPGYHIFRSTLEKTSIATNEAVLTEGVKHLENNLRMLQSASRTLIKSDKILLLTALGDELTPSDGYTIKESLETFRNTTNRLALPGECGLYLKNGKLLFHDQFYMDADFFYPQFLSVDGKADFSGWLHSLKEDKAPFTITHEIVTSLGYTYDAFIYAEPLPMQTNWKSSVFFTIFKIEDVANLLVLPDTLHNARLAFTFPTGEQLFSYSFLRENDRFIHISADIPSLGLTANLDLRYDYVMSNTRIYASYILVFFGVYLLCGMILFVFLIRRNLRPILGFMKNAEQLLEEMHPGKHSHDMQASDSMNDFLQFIRTMLRDNRALLQEQQETLRGSIFELALRDCMPLEQDPIMQGLFDDFPNEWQMILLRIPSWTKRPPEDCSAIHIYAKTLLSSLPETKWHHLSSDMMIIVLPASLSQSDVEQLISRIREAFLLEVRVEIQSAVSRNRTGMSSLPEAFALLRTRLRVLESEVSTLSYVEGEESLPFVCAVTDTSLYETIMRGDSTAVHKKICSLAERYRQLKYISETDLMQYFFLCRSAILQAGYDLNLDDYTYPEYSTKTDIQSMCALLCHCADDICAFAQKRLLENADSFDEKLLSWIREHLKDNNLCIQSTVEAFAISPSTLQRVIRRRTAVTFQEYVEASRMNLACDLLKNTSLPTKDISAKCGFSSPNSFYKAFRRCFQMSPTDMRKQLND